MGQTIAMLPLMSALTSPTIARDAKATAAPAQILYQRKRAEEDKQCREAQRAKADEEAKRAKAKQKKAKAARAAADEAAAEAKARAEKAQKALREGIKPVIMPTREEYEATKERLEYKQGFFRFAVAGTEGSSKLSLISVAKTGVTETTSIVTRYVDPNEANPFVWSDIPGAGTLSMPEREYFIEQGLYIFDCIIVLIDNGFTDTDVAILRNCAHSQIPSYIVRSKSRDMLRDDEEEGEKACMEKAIEKYVAKTGDSVAQNLEKAKLPQQQVNAVDKKSLVLVANGKVPRILLDDLELVKDLREEARTRRMFASTCPSHKAIFPGQINGAVDIWNGTCSIIMPTEVEYTAIKERLQYTEGFFHFAVTDISGSGKSLLISAFCGFEIVRYTDTNTANPFLWYDVPGAGTLDVPDWNYFNTQGLYVFDCIIVLIDTRFTQTDEAILRNCARFQIPTYIVRSKSKQHIQNVLDDLPEDDSGDEDGEDDARMEKAMEKYIAETQDSVAKNLARAKLPQQKVYMVDKDFMVQVVKGKQPKDFFDEWKLLKDMLAKARIRRYMVCRKARPLYWTIALRPKKETRLQLGARTSNWHINQTANCNRVENPS
ncbi:predicted protein [Postia placenta Mad-698-R]|nr:predicted protein [Postia placenta Mad-698-R]